MNGFVTDANYFTVNKKFYKFSSALLIIAVILPIVYSQPDNELELPSSSSSSSSSNTQITNDNNNGIVKNNRLHNGLMVRGIGNGNGNLKSYHVSKGLRFKKSQYIKNRTDKKKYLDPNKKYFDYYPIEKVKLSYDSKEDDNVEVELLSEKEEKDENLIKKNRSKRDLTKHDLTKRDLTKRNAGYSYQQPMDLNQWIYLQPNQEYLKYPKIPIAGNYYNPISPSGFYNVDQLPISFTNTRVDTEYPVWDRIPKRPVDRRPGTITTKSPPLIHRATPPSSSSSSNRFDESTTKKPTSPKKISACVWAIVDCCTKGSERIRYGCFKEVGCEGSFFDINPCADNILNKANSIVDDYYKGDN